MKAVRQNIVNQERIKLEEAIPLKMPLSISIDPCNLCNFKCEFCAAQTSERKLSYKKQMMNKELLIKIVNDIKKTNTKLKMIRFAADGEPLLNPKLPEMIAYVKKMDITEYIEVVTNGSRFNPELNERIVNSGVDRIRISVEAIDEKGYYEMAHVKIDFDGFLNNIADLYERSRGKCEIYIKTVDAAVKDKEQQDRFYELFENKCDRIFIDSVIPLWADFGEIENRFDLKHVGLHQQQLCNVKVCPYSFYSCIINPDGEVTACCSDWERKFVIGDVKNEDFWDIWNSDKLRTFWIEQLEGKRFCNDLCSKCLLPDYDCIDNIDDKADEILAGMSRI